VNENFQIIRADHGPWEIDDVMNLNEMTHKDEMEYSKRQKQETEPSTINHQPSSELNG
jgi:hypothetical protein